MILDDVACLFVEQYESMHGLYTESYRKSEVDLIRSSAEEGELALYTAVATLFGDKLEDVLVRAAKGAMDYIAYVDETWMPKDDDDRMDTLAMELVHLESLEVILRMGRQNECCAVEEIERIDREGKFHFQRLQQREIDL